MTEKQKEEMTTIDYWIRHGKDENYSKDSQIFLLKEAINHLYNKCLVLMQERDKNETN